jgi:hypothetical protein
VKIEGKTHNQNSNGKGKKNNTSFIVKDAIDATRRAFA